MDIKKISEILEEFARDFTTGELDREFFKDFVIYNDLGIPLAQAVTYELAEPTEAGEGVIVETLKIFQDHEGKFIELMKSGDKQETGTVALGDVKQINYSLLPPNTLKAWHIHEKQTDVWFIPPGNLCNVGLWDIRMGSKTQSYKYLLKINNTEDKFYKITIPRGVAHGIQSLTYPVNMLYCVTQEFNPYLADELRAAPGAELSNEEISEGNKFWD